MYICFKKYRDHTDGRCLSRPNAAVIIRSQPLSFISTWNVFFFLQIKVQLCALIQNEYNGPPSTSINWKTILRNNFALSIHSFFFYLMSIAAWTATWNMYNRIIERSSLVCLTLSISFSLCVWALAAGFFPLFFWCVVKWMDLWWWTRVRDYLLQISSIILIIWQLIESSIYQIQINK